MVCETEKQDRDEAFEALTLATEAVGQASAALAAAVADMAEKSLAFAAAQGAFDGCLEAASGLPDPDEPGGEPESP